MLVRYGSNISQRKVKWLSKMGHISIRDTGQDKMISLEIDQMLVRDGSNISQRYRSNGQGSHEHWKTWKTWKSTNKSSMHGKIMEFENN